MGFRLAIQWVERTNSAISSSNVKEGLATAEPIQSLRR
jgi:hypothetical protein